MADIVAKEVQIKVKLDISDAQRKGRILRAIGHGTGVKSGPSVGGGGRPKAEGGTLASASFKAAKESSRGIVGQSVEAAGRIAAQAGSPVARVAQTAATAVGFSGASGAAGSILKLGGKAALAYGIGRVALKAGLAYTALLEGAAEGSDVTERLVEMFNGLEAKVTAMESRVIALYEAGIRTKEIAGAAVQVSGQVPNVARIYAEQYEYSAQERNLEKAFERFKSIQTSKSIGDENGKMVRSGMGR